MSISLEQVSKHYEEAPAVSDVSLSISEGELFVLLGPSGSGKSTLLRAIAGLTAIDHGRIVLHGRDVTNVSAREREVGFVFQNYALFRHMSVAENIEFALRARRVRARVRRERRRELLELVSLAGFDERLPAELSGGQQQRVALARALAHAPRVLLLDEPFGALDAKIREELRRAVREVQRRLGITTILVTHDQDEAFTMADRIGVMDRGRLQEAGEPRALYARPRTRFVATFLGAANLLLGCHERQGVRLGRSVFGLELEERRSHSFRPGAEAAVLVRPEDVVVTPAPGRFAADCVGVGRIAELEFTGATERIRLSVAADDALASALRPGAESFMLEGARDAHEAERLPLTVGQEVAIGANRVHVLPTPISSLRLLARSAEEGARLETSALVRDLGEQLRILPTRHFGGDADEPRALLGLPVVELARVRALSPAVQVVEQGAAQVLAVRPGSAPIERVLMYVQASRAARDGALSAAGSLLRHLAVDGTLLVPADDRSRHAPSYRQLLDLRSAALRLHGVDVRTQTFHGGLASAVRRRLATPPAATLLLVGLTSMAAGTSLLEELEGVLSESALAGVLLVCGRAEVEPPVLHGASERNPIPYARSPIERAAASGR
jgi:ABC-type Fe3+/spermidine/putrescine transport system ATPase subunit